MFDTSELFIQCSKDSCCEHISGGANIYSYGFVSVYWPLSVFCVSVCMISNQSTGKKPHYMSDLSKLNAWFHKTHITVLLLLSYQDLTCVDP